MHPVEERRRRPLSRSGSGDRLPPCPLRIQCESQSPILLPPLTLPSSSAMVPQPWCRSRAGVPPRPRGGAGADLQGMPIWGHGIPCTSGQYKATLMYLPIISINSFLLFECCSPTLQAPATASGSIWTRTHGLAQVAKLNVRTSIGFAWFCRWECQWLDLCR